MHTLGDGPNKYVAMLFLKMSKEYWALGTAGMHQISVQHARDLMQFAPLLSHVVTSSTDARYDQVTMIEADTLEQIHAAATAFRVGAKGQYIAVVDTVVGVKAPARAPQVRAAQAQAAAAAAGNPTP